MQPNPSARARWLTLLLPAVGLALLVLGCGPEDEVPATQPGGVGTGDVTVDVVADDLFYESDVVTVTAGANLTINLTNVGALQHDLRLDDAVTTAIVDPGGSDTLVVGTIDEPVTLFCSIEGHREAGMELQVEVADFEADNTERVVAQDGDGHGGGSSGEPGAVIDFNAVPGENWQPFDPTLEPAPGGTEHELTIVAAETVLEVAPGVTQEMWTFNGTYPGPILRGKIGDIFTITLRNEGRLGHSIDFHASKVAWDDEMRTLQPGEELVYQFEAEYSGIFMYHCGTAPTLHHIGNGMFGAVIIDPPDLPPVDHEFVIVQSEIYTGPEGEAGDFDKMTRDAWDAIVFNGYVNQYLHAPIRVEVDERVRVWVIDNGPSENSSFHIVGTIFDTSYKEGAYLLQPDETRGGSQALDLQPAQGGFVEFTFAEAGLYPMVTHKFSNVGKGALGLFQAGEVPDRENDGVVSVSAG
ncbi:MAG: multicopper oxidase domain-containing protein [Acidimicrobiia bacterium]|nr:multicopper oxidase domain-containing protein [Acidimicrobiia bacterium]